MATEGSAAPSATAVSGLTGVTRYTDLKNAPKTVKETMGKTEFLTLFTTQLQNQNPLDPVNNEAFVAQLAQFSQLEATTNMSTSLESMSQAMKSERFMNGANLIGKQVTAPLGDAKYVAGSTLSGLIQLPTGADQVTLEVFDSQQRKIHSQSLGRQMPGDLKLSWNGALDAGGTAPSGTYRVIATVSSLGKVTQTPISTPMTVKSVTYSAAEDDLIVEVEGGATVPLRQLTRIEAPAAGSTGTVPAGGAASTQGDSTLNDRINAELSRLFTGSGTAGPVSPSTAPASGTSPSSAGLADALQNLFRP